MQHYEEKRKEKLRLIKEVSYHYIVVNTNRKDKLSSMKQKEAVRY
jgi:hypothetical protein